MSAVFHGTDKLAETAGVSWYTILKWRRLGFFEDCPPHRTGDGKTTGAGYHWSEQALDRVRLIKAKREAGFSMDQILDELRAAGLPGPAPDKKKKRGR